MEIKIFFKRTGLTLRFAYRRREALVWIDGREETVSSNGTINMYFLKVYKKLIKELIRRKAIGFEMNAITFTETSDQITNENLTEEGKQMFEEALVSMINYTAEKD